ncbi:MAG: HlyD family efflux transporter periplasmic adaptor subunit [Polyangiaceae bacterium]
MKKQLIAGVMLVLVLSAVLAYRAHAQSSYKHAPSGGSATLEGTEAVIATKVAGRLVEVLVQEGDAVKPGQIVARFDCEDQQAALALAEARAKQAEAQITLAEKGVAGAQDAARAAQAQVAVASARSGSLEIQRQKAERDRGRIDALAKTGSVSTYEQDSITTAEKGLEAELKTVAANVGAASLAARAQASGVNTAGAQVEVARAGLEAAKADVRRAQLAVDECVLKAPRAGLIVDRLHEPGAVLTPGSRVLTMIDISTVKATFFLPNAELGRAQIGATAEVRVDTYPGKVFTGTVRHVASEAEFTPRNVQTREDRDRLVYAVEVDLENASGELRAGMPAEVTLPGTGK